MVTCPVTLQEGLNDLIVQVMDKAGNSGSTGIHVSRIGAPSVPTIVPDTATLIVGATRNVQLVDGSGRPLVADSWSVSSPFIAAMQQAGDQVSVRALGPGQVTVTANWQRLTVQAQFTVIREEKAPVGTTLWKVARPGFIVDNIVYTHPTPGGPDMITIERPTGGGRVSLRAVTAAPIVLWAESPGIRDDEAIVDFMGETFGGVLLRVDGTNRRSSAIVRAGRPSKGPLWRYESAGTLATDFAQGWDGTVYIVETMPDGYPQFVGLDGATGIVKFRWSIPRSSRSRPGFACGADPVRDDAPAVVGNPTVPDGMMSAFAFVTLEELSDAAACAQGRRQFVRTLHLARVTAAGAIEVQVVKAFPGSTEAGLPSIAVRLVAPHYDALLVPWVATAANGRVVNQITRFDGDQVSEYSLPFLGELGLGDNTAYTVTADKRTLVVFNPVSGEVRYVRHSATGKLAVLSVGADGNVLIHHTGGGGVLLDENMKPAPVQPKKP